MFSRKKKKVFPHGTFIPLPARILAIIQLCLAFTLICWSCGLPFMGDLFSHKSKMLLYQNAMGDNALIQKLNPAKGHILQFERNAKRFKNLPPKDQERMIQEYESIQKASQISFLDKLKKSGKILAFGLPPFELAWIFFTITISLMLLKRVEGAAQAVWLLPLIVGIYAFNNQLSGTVIDSSQETRLFPTEEMIVKDYLHEPLSTSILTQREQLLKGWHLYLIKEWAKEEPRNDQFDLQVEEGEYHFNLARLKTLSHAQLQESSFKMLHKKEPIALLLAYFLWNLFFAWFVSSKKKREKEDIADNDAFAT